MDRISSAVGKGAPNRKEDVRKIQRLLNRFRHEGDSLLKVDGLAGWRTVTAIEHFQHVRVHLPKIDGRVDPHGPTLARLREHPGLQGRVHPQHLIPKAPPKPQSSTPSTTAARNTSASAQAPASGSTPHPAVNTIAWGAKVSSTFKSKAIAISERLQISPDFLMSCMAFESGETFSSIVRNAAGSGAVGLIQFMPSTAKSLKTTTGALTSLSPEQQLDYVEAYFKPYAGRLHTIEDIYMAILYPKAIGKGADYVLFKSGTVAFAQNKGLDADKDGQVTAQEAASAVRRKYQKGLGIGFLG